MDLVMSHVEQKESIKITIPEAGILPKNVPVVDQYLNNYRSHKATAITVVVSNQLSTAAKNSNSSQLQNANSCKARHIDELYTVSSNGKINLH